MVCDYRGRVLTLAKVLKLANRDYVRIAATAATVAAPEPSRRLPPRVWGASPLSGGRVRV